MKNEKSEIMTLTRKTTILGIFFLTLLSVLVLYKAHSPISLPIARERKMVGEIEGIKTKTYDLKICEQYALLALENGFFPCYNCEGTAKIYLKIGEVWKYGKTCNGVQGRYPSGLPNPNLRYQMQFTGTEEQCLIIEKQKIYSYILLPENVLRAKETGTQPLMRPPGNKIDR